MKKIISLILTFTILATMTGLFTVNAEIPVGDGMGVELVFKQLKGTSPSSGAYYSVSAVESTEFDSAYNYIYKGGNSKTLVQLAMYFTNTQAVAANDYFYISFYYKLNQNDTYTLPTGVNRFELINGKGNKPAIGTVSEEWQKASYVAKASAAVASGTDVYQTLLLSIAGDAPASMDIAEPTCIYFGAVTGDDAEAQILDAIAKAESTPEAPAISVNNGKGSTLAFKEIKRNSPSSGSAAPISAIADSKFGTVTRYEYTAATTANVQMSLLFTNNQNIAVGDTVNLSFYYRFTDDDTYNLPSSIKRRNNLNVDGAGQVNVGSGFTSGKWEKANITLTADTAVASGTDAFVRFLVFITNGDKICMDIANPTLTYFGKVNSDDVEAEINAQLDKSAFSSISIGGTPIDLEANPTSYTTEAIVSEEDISAVGYHEHSVVEITSEETDTTVAYTVKSYATGYDFTDANDTRYSTYTITAVKPAPPISVNGGKGQALEFNAFLGNKPSDPQYYKSSKLDGTGFDKAYRYEYLGNFNSNIVQTSLSFKNDNAIPAGEYFYMTFYYRFVEDDTHVLPKAIQRRKYVTDSGDKVNMTTGVATEWTKAEFILTNTNAIEAGVSVDLRFLMTLVNGADENGIYTDKICMDIANPACVYFGAITADAEKAINDQISKSDISAIKINGNAIDLAANPTSYTTSEKAEYDNVVIEGYHNPSVVTKSVSKENGTVTYNITAYAVDYDYLDANDTRKSTYTVTVAAPDYDVYGYDYSVKANGCEVTALFDNNTADSTGFDYIVAVYGDDGRLIGTDSVNYSNIAGSTKENKLSATVENITSGFPNIKIFIWNSESGLQPVLNSKTID